MATVDMLGIARIVREVAADEILPRWRNLAADEVQTKSRAGDLVTVADHAAEAALSRRFGAALPGSRVVGEEAVAADPEVLHHFRDADPVWVIDPIDGTRNFTQGGSTFDVMVALVVGGEPVAGWIYAPAEDTLYLGETGSGAALHDASGMRPIAAPEGLSLSECEGILGAGAFTSRGRRDPEAVRHQFRGYSRPTCAGHNYGRILSGESQFLINFSTHPWDHLPGLAISMAAGFRAARHDGAPFDPLDRLGGILIAPDSATWDAIHALLLSDPVP
jgi:fructose-1,6-bisphosphatase/inositol monophosphatase family enzyme